MRIADVMTKDVEALTPETTLRDAAQRMRDLDVGAMPVTQGGVPLGIVTDRDLVIRAAAEGRDPGSCTVREVMTHQAVTVKAGDSVEQAAEVMRVHQVRRVMVIDEMNKLCGIVSLGDLSVRTHDDELASDTLEEVSSPGHPQGAGARLDMGPDRMPEEPSGYGYGGDALRQARDYMPEAGAGAGALLGLAAGLMIGMGLAFMFDPDRGRTRRALTRDRMQRTAREARSEARRTARQMGAQAQGMAAGVRRAMVSAAADDRVLRERVRAAMGHVVSHAHAVHVDVYGGVVTLSGPILAHEVRDLMKTVVAVHGVRDVINELEPHETGAGIPALQGGRMKDR